MNYPDINSLADHIISGKTGLIRAATDVLDRKGDIKSDKRIAVLKPTIDKLFNRGAENLVIFAYFGRPVRYYKNKIKRYSGVLYEPEMSGTPIAERLSEICNRKVHFISSLSKKGDFYEDYKDYLKLVKDFLKHNNTKGEIIFLDNLRFWDQESDKNSEGFEDFVQKISELGDFYIQECYPQAHRENSTVVKVADHFKGRSVFGESYKKELHYFSDLRQKLKDKNRGPAVFIFGGVKVKTGPNIISKITVAKKLLEQLKAGDHIIIGGALSYTFRVARHMQFNDITDPADVSDEEILSLVGNSRVQKEVISDALEILKKADEKGVLYNKPVDHRTTDALDDAGKVLFSGKKLAEHANIVVTGRKIPLGRAGVDIGPETEEIYKNAIKNSEIIFIAGPLGIFEDERSAAGSINFIKAMGEATERGIETIAAGGETEALVSMAGVKLSHVSTGGGAALEDIQKDGKLPGTTAVLKSAGYL